MTWFFVAHVWNIDADTVLGTALFFEEISMASRDALLASGLGIWYTLWLFNIAMV